MSDGPAPGDRRPVAGGATSGKGTPVAVDVSGDPRARRRIALFLAGPVIWSLHFMAVYLVVEAGCSGGGQGLEVFAPPVPTVVTLAATAAAFAASLVAAWLAYRGWRADRHATGPQDGTGLEPVDPGGSLALAGWLLSLLAAVHILFVGLPALVLPAC